MKQLTKKRFTSFVAAFVFAFATLATAGLVTVSDTSAADTNFSLQNGVEAAQGTNVPQRDIFGGSDSIFTMVVNFLLYFIGAICVIMLIWGGIRYATSAGNSASVTAAKNTILYAVIGLIIAILAYAIVNWVLGLFITPVAGN